MVLRILDSLAVKKIIKRFRVFLQLLLLFCVFLVTGWVWHYSNHENTELKLYALQAIAEIIVAVFETIATFLMIKSIKQNGDANREMKRMNEKLQISMQAQTDVLKQQQEFYAIQLREKQSEIRKLEKVKVFNRYLSYVKNFLFAYNRRENFDGINTRKLFLEKRQKNKIKNDSFKVKDDKMTMLLEILEVKLTPNTDLENYMFAADVDDGDCIKKDDKILLTGSDKDVVRRFDCLLREYRYKLKTKLPVILANYFEDFEKNEELQEICG